MMVGSGCPLTDDMLTALSPGPVCSDLVNHPSFALPDKIIGPGHEGQIAATDRGARGASVLTFPSPRWLGDQQVHQLTSTAA